VSWSTTTQWTAAAVAATGFVAVAVAAVRHRGNRIGSPTP